MGFFDSLKKISGAVAKELGEAAKDAAHSVSEYKNSTAAQTPAKPSRLYEDEFGDRKYSFMISGDFIEFNSHCEIMPAFQYEPDRNASGNDYTGYEEKLPHIGIGPDDGIYDAVEEFEKSGTLPEGSYEKCDSEYFAFRCSFDAYGLKYYAYAFRSSTARELEMLSLDYHSDIAGTPLENKLKAILDEAASTYKEWEKQ